MFSCSLKNGTTIEVTNTGASTFKGPLSLSDYLTDGSAAPITSLDPGTCMDNRTALPLDCKTAFVSLDPGKSWSTHMTITLPQTSAKQFTNCVATVLSTIF